VGSKPDSFAKLTGRIKRGGEGNGKNIGGAITGDGEGTEEEKKGIEILLT